MEVTDFKSEVRFDLRGCLEAVVAPEAATNRQYKQYEHVYVGIQVTYFISEVRFDLQGCLEAVVASGAAKNNPYLINNMHMDE